MATIRKRGGKYEVQVRRKNLSSINRSFRKLSDAREWARLTESKVDRHELAPDRGLLQHLTLGELVQRYRDNVTINKKGGDVEAVVLNAFLRHAICKKTLSQLTTTHFANYRDERLQVVTGVTLKRQFGTLRHMFRHAMEEWEVPLDSCPLAKVSLDAPDKKRERRLRAGELTALLTASRSCRNPLVIVVVQFALETAMRRGEMLSLLLGDVDPQRGSVTIRDSKNGYSRTIPLTPKALELLQESISIASEKAGKPSARSRIFPLSPNGFRLAWDRLVKRAGVDDLHFHDLRHEAISSLFEKGLTMPEVASISGHRDARMLLRYAHANQALVRVKLGAILRCDQPEA